MRLMASLMTKYFNFYQGHDQWFQVEVCVGQCIHVFHRCVGVSFDVNCSVAHRVQGKCPPGTTNSTDLLIFHFIIYHFSIAIGIIPVAITIFLIRALFLALLGTFSRKSVTFLMVPMTRMTKGSMFELKSVLNFFSTFS